MKMDSHKVKQTNDKLTIQLVKDGDKCFYYFSLKEICQRWNLQFDFKKDIEKVYEEFKYLFEFEDGETQEENEIIKQLIDSSIILGKRNKGNDIQINYDYLLSIMSRIFSPEIALSVYKYLEKKIFAYKCGNLDFLDMVSNTRG